MSEFRPVGALPIRRTRRLLLTLGALSTFAPLSIDLYLPALPELGRELHASDGAAQWTVSMVLIGMAAGQLIVGPMSDRFGRRRPLLVGVAAFGVASLACALAPSIGALIALRFLQGLAGSAGTVVVEAMVRDLYEGRAMAHVLSLLVLVSGLAPILAPVIGGQLLRVTDWRGLFVALAALSVVLLAAVTTLPETMSARRRSDPPPRRVRESFAGLGRDRVFVGCALGGSIGGVSFFVYITASAFVLESGFGLSPQQFSWVFGANSVGLMIAGYLNTRLLRHHEPGVLLIAGSVVALAASVFMVLASVLQAPLAVFLATLFLTVSVSGLIMPNSTAVALARHPDRAATAAAVLGSSGFASGAVLAPLVSARGSNSVAMSAGMAVALAGAWLAYALLARPHRPVGPVPAPARGQASA